MSDRPDLDKLEAVESAVYSEEAYRAARAYAMQQFKDTEPKLKELQQTILQLRFVIRGLSFLLGEDVPYDYSFEKAADIAQHAREVSDRQKNKKRVHVTVTSNQGRSNQPPLPKPNVFHVGQDGIATPTTKKDEAK